MLTRMVKDAAAIVKKIANLEQQKFVLEQDIEEQEFKLAQDYENLQNCLSIAQSPEDVEKCQVEYTSTTDETKAYIASLKNSLDIVNESLETYYKQLEGEEYLIPVDNVLMINTSLNTDFISTSCRAVCLQYKEFNAEYNPYSDLLIPRMVSCFIEVYGYQGTDEQLLTDVAESVIKTVKTPNSQPSLSFRYSNVYVNRVVEPYFGD